MKQILFFFLLVSISSFSQGKLEKAKKSLSKESSSSKSEEVSAVSSYASSSSNEDSSSSFDGDDECFNVGDVFLVIKHVFFGDLEERSLQPHIYYDYGEYTTSLDSLAKKSNLKIGANYLASNTRALGINVLFKPIPILGLEVSHVNFREKFVLKNERLDYSSVMLNFYRFREKYLTAWWGVGIGRVWNEVATSGFTYGFGTEIYPVEPISLRVSYKESLINATSVREFSSSVKYHRKKAAFSVGYTNYRLGTEHVKGVAMGIEYTF